MRNAAAALTVLAVAGVVGVGACSTTSGTGCPPRHSARRGLVKQLTFDGFTPAEAAYAVGHIKVDWNKQAETAAKDYLDTQAFSKAELIAQLKFDGFTAAEAVHGATAAGL